MGRPQAPATTQSVGQGNYRVVGRPSDKIVGDNLTKNNDNDKMPYVGLGFMFGNWEGKRETKQIVCYTLRYTTFCIINLLIRVLIHLTTNHTEHRSALSLPTERHGLFSFSFAAMLSTTKILRMWSPFSPSLLCRIVRKAEWRN